MHLRDGEEWFCLPKPAPKLLHILKCSYFLLGLIASNTLNPPYGGGSGSYYGEGLERMWTAVSIYLQGLWLLLGNAELMIKLPLCESANAPPK